MGAVVGNEASGVAERAVARSGDGARGGGGGGGGGRRGGAVDIEKLKELVSIDRVAAACGCELGKKSGGEWSILCPFHDDHTPSMSLVPKKQMAFCHSCGWSGDVVSFMQQYRRIGLREAAEQVAQLAGLSLEQVLERADAELTPQQRAEAAKRREEAQRAAEERQAAEAEEKFALAQSVWGRAKDGTNHPQMRAYFQSRGIPLTNLGELPQSLRLVERLKRTKQRNDEPHVVDCELPCVLAAMGHPDRPAGKKIVALQRIYLRDDGVAGKWNGGGDAKLTIGSYGSACPGARIVLLSQPNARTLIVSEGVETGVAIADAMAGQTQTPVVVWSVMSTSGLKNLILKPDEAAKYDEVIVAADADRVRARRDGDAWVASAPGLEAAHEAAGLLREAGIAGVAVRPPTAEVDARVDAFGLPISDETKSVDWLDVWAAEAAGKIEPGSTVKGLLWGRSIDDTQELGAAMAARLGPVDLQEHGADAGEDEVVERGGRAEDLGEHEDDGGGGGGEGGRVVPPWLGGDDDDEDDVLPDKGTLRAQKILLEMFSPTDRVLRECEGAAWTLAYKEETWWVYSNADGRSQAPRWVPIRHDLLAARIRTYTDTLRQIKWEEVKDKETGKKVWKKFYRQCALGARTIVDILEAMKAYVAVMGTQMPRWLDCQIDAKGRSTFEHAVKFDPQVADDRDLPDPKSVVAWSNGLIDTDALVEEPDDAFMPHTSRWFSALCVPAKFPKDDLVRLAKFTEDKAWHPGGEIDAYFAARCPVYLKFIREVLQGQEDQVRAFEEFAGYLQTGDTSLHKLLWIQGPSGGGKSVLARILHGLVGDDNIAMINLGHLSGRFDTSSLQGRALYHMDEARVGPFTDTAGALDNLLRISTGEPVRVEQKGGETTMVKLSGKIVITLNEEPSWKDAAGALTRRLLMLVTGDPPKKPDRLLSRKLASELPWIALRALLRLRILRERGEFLQPTASQPIIDEMARTMDDVRSFVEDCCVLEAGSQTKVDDLFKAFRAWSEDVNHAETNMKVATFGRRLKAVVGASKLATRQREGAEGRVRYYEGIRLLQAWDRPTQGTIPGAADGEDIPF